MFLRRFGSWEFALYIDLFTLGMRNLIALAPFWDWTEAGRKLQLVVRKMP